MDFLAFWALVYMRQFNISQKKTSVIRLPKFTIVNMARKWNQRATYSIENLFFEDYSFRSLMADVFLH